MRSRKSYVFLTGLIFILIIWYLYEVTPHKQGIKTEQTKKEGHLGNNQTSNQTLLIYNAVPKCGSQTFRAAMQQLKRRLHYRFTEENCHFPFHLSSFHHNRDNTHNVIREIEQENIYNSNHIYYKHFHFIDFRKYGSSLDQPLYVNIIRDPVDHYVSWYYFRRSYKAIFPPIFGPIKWFDYELYNRNMRTKDPIKLEYVVFENCADCAEYYTSNEWSKIRNMTFDECVLTGNEECIDLSYTFRMIPFFCGMDDLCLQPSRRTLNQAKRNVALYYPLVGYIENLEQFFELAEMIWPQFFKGAVSILKADKGSRKNDGKWREKSDKYKPSERVKLIMKDRLKLEYEFYEWIKHRFHSMYEMYVQKKGNE